MVTGMHIAARAMQKVYCSKAFAEDGALMIIIFKAEAAHFVNTWYMGIGRSAADAYVIHTLEAGAGHK